MVREIEYKVVVVAVAVAVAAAAAAVEMKQMNKRYKRKTPMPTGLTGPTSCKPVLHLPQGWPIIKSQIVVTRDRLKPPYFPPPPPKPPTPNPGMFMFASGHT